MVFHEALGSNGKGELHEQPTGPDIEGSGEGLVRPLSTEGSFVLPKKHVELSEQENADLVGLVMREYGTKSIDTFYQTVRNGQGKEVLGKVSERGEEKEIALESNLEHMFVNICDEHKLPTYIIGEHHSYRTPLSNGIEPRNVTLVDSLDDTRENEQGDLGHPGLPAPLWTGGFTYDLEGKPIAGVMANLKENYMYFSVNGKNYRKDLETGEEKEIYPSERTSMKDEKFCLATYLGDPTYALSFFEIFSEGLKVLKKAGKDPIIQPHSGSFIYWLMAEGLVDAYLIDKEPTSERLPGWGAAKIKGFKAWEVNPENGRFEEVKDDFRLIKDNPVEYRKRRMSVYLVTRFNEIRDEMIPLIVNSFQEKKEFEIFKASRQTKQAQNSLDN